MRMKNGRKKCPSSPVSWKVRHQRFLPSKSSANHLQNGCHYHHQPIQMTHLLKIIIMWLQAEKIVCTTNPGSSYFQIRVGLWPRPPPICCSTMQCICRSTKQCIWRSTMQCICRWLCIVFVCIRQKSAIFFAILYFFYISFVQRKLWLLPLYASYRGAIWALFQFCKSLLHWTVSCPCILCLYGQLNIFCVFCMNTFKSMRVQFTMRFSGAGGFASLCRKSRLCGGLGGKTGGGGGRK